MNVWKNWFYMANNVEKFQKQKHKKEVLGFGNFCTLKAFHLLRNPLWLGQAGIVWRREISTFLSFCNHWTIFSLAWQRIIKIRLQLSDEVIKKAWAFGVPQIEIKMFAFLIERISKS